MKKLVFALASIILLLSFASCDNAQKVESGTVENTENKANNRAETEETTVSVPESGSDYTEMSDATDESVLKNEDTSSVTDEPDGNITLLDNIFIYLKETESLFPPGDNFDAVAVNCSKGYNLAIDLIGGQSVFIKDKLEVFRSVGGPVITSPKDFYEGFLTNNLPYVYAIIKYYGINEDVLRAAAKQERENFMRSVLSGEETDENNLTYKLKNLLFDEDIDVLYHGTETEIKKHFKRPFVFIDEDGTAYTPSNMRMNWNNSELPDRIRTAYKEQVLKDLIACGTIRYGADSYYAEFFNRILNEGLDASTSDN